MRGPIFVGAYGDCIDLKEATLWKEATNTDMVELVFRRLNVGWLVIFDIKASKGNGYDSKRLDLGKRLPLRPNGTFWQWRLRKENSYNKFLFGFGNFLISVIFPFLHFGQHVISVPVNRSIISWIVSLTFPGNFASGLISFLKTGMACLLFLWAKNPK